MTQRPKICALFSAGDHVWPDYQDALPPAFASAGLTVDLSRDHAPETVDYIIAAPNGPVQDFTPFTQCKAVLNLWAGVEDIAPNKTLTQPLARMVDPGLTDGMVNGLWATLCAITLAWTRIFKGKTVCGVRNTHPLRLIGLSPSSGLGHWARPAQTHLPHSGCQ